MKLKAIAAVAILALSAPATAAFAAEAPALEPAAPFLTELRVRGDAPVTAPPSTKAGEVVLRFGVRHGETARLAEDLKVRNESFFGPGTEMREGLTFYHAGSQKISMMGVKLTIDAWCAPDRLDEAGKPAPICLLFRESWAASKGTQAVLPNLGTHTGGVLMVPDGDSGLPKAYLRDQATLKTEMARQNPLFVRALLLKGGWGRELKLEPAPAIFAGEMTMSFVVVGRKDGALLFDQILDVTRTPFADAHWTWRRSAAIGADGSAVLDLGEAGRLIIRPGEGEAYSLDLQGPLAARRPS